MAKSWWGEYPSYCWWESFSTLAETAILADIVPDSAPGSRKTVMFHFEWIEVNKTRMSEK